MYPFITFQTSMMLINFSFLVLLVTEAWSLQRTATSTNHRFLQRCYATGSSSSKKGLLLRKLLSSRQSESTRLPLATESESPSVQQKEIPLKPIAPTEVQPVVSPALTSDTSTPKTSASPKPTSFQTWRLFNVDVPLDKDPGKDDISVHEHLKTAISTKLQQYIRDTKVLPDLLSQSTIEVIKKSFDGRWKKLGQPQFSYTVDLHVPLSLTKRLRIKSIEGRMERIDPKVVLRQRPSFDPADKSLPRIVIVGSGPAGLFCALSLIEAGLCPIIIERGQPVEIRGKDIGALINRRILNHDSNLCYGEGGAGTWSDGKLTTRIGKNSEDVRKVLQLLVDHGAPARILVDGKPHLGTDRLVIILRNIRKTLSAQGSTFLFNTTVSDIRIADKAISGVQLANGTQLPAEAVVLAVGHSGRRMYERLLDHNVTLVPKGIAVGFRVEHPQELINSISYGEFGALCERGKGPVPVADYRLVTSVSGGTNRSVYSFCMCPGGQIVPTSVREDELCVNGMSFSKRQSKWANSALVVTVSPEDMVELAGSSPLRGVDWQTLMEKRAAVMGGGSLVAPVQRVTDFLKGVLSEDPLPTSSYRLGVKSAPLHELYPPFVTAALREAIRSFERSMPGFITPEALLHGVETRTSSPVQISRKVDSFESVALRGLYPSGEGAGYAGGIVSAAVDGMKVGAAIIKSIAQSRQASTKAPAPGTIEK